MLLSFSLFLLVLRSQADMVKDNKDVVGCGAVKDSNGCLVVESARVRNIWIEYYEKVAE